MRVFSLLLLSCGFLACSDDDPVVSGDGGSPVEDAGSRVDASTTRPDASVKDSGGDAAPAGTCAAASAGLKTTADANAPVLDAAASMLQRVASNDASCTSQQVDHPGLGSYGYLLNVAYTDADGDAPTLSELVDPGGFMRFGSAPDAQVDTRFDPAHGWTTQGSAQQGTVILQLCLDRVYAAGALTLAVDYADVAGHRSKAICIAEPVGN